MDGEGEGFNQARRGILFKIIENKKIKAGN